MKTNSIDKGSKLYKAGPEKQVRDKSNISFLGKKLKQLKEETRQNKFLEPKINKKLLQEKKLDSSLDKNKDNSIKKSLSLKSNNNNQSLSKSSVKRNPYISSKLDESSISKHSNFENVPKIRNINPINRISFQQKLKNVKSKINFRNSSKEFLSKNIKNTQTPSKSKDNKSEVASKINKSSEKTIDKHSLAESSLSKRLKPTSAKKKNNNEEINFSSAQKNSSKKMISHSVEKYKKSTPEKKSIAAINSTPKKNSNNNVYSIQKKIELSSNPRSSSKKSAIKYSLDHKPLTNSKTYLSASKTLSSNKKLTNNKIIEKDNKLNITMASKATKASTSKLKKKDLKMKSKEKVALGEDKTRKNISVKNDLTQSEKKKKSKYANIKSKVALHRQKPIETSKQNSIKNANLKFEKKNQSLKSQQKTEIKSKKNNQKQASLKKVSITKQISETRNNRSEIYSNENQELNINTIPNDQQANSLKEFVNPTRTLNHEEQKPENLKDNEQENFDKKKDFLPKKMSNLTDEKHRTLIHSMKSIKSDIYKNNYMGKGKNGLDDVEMEIEECQQEISDNPLYQLNKSNLPCFSEGYLFKKFISDEQSGDITKQEEKMEIDSNIKNQNTNIQINQTSPQKMLTNKLTTAIKTSMKKQIPFDTELKLLSKEFRYLLSGKHQEAKETQDLYKEKLLKKKEVEEQKDIEKRLDFHQDDAGVHSCENEEGIENMDDQDIVSLENDILEKVLEENFGFKKFLPGQLETIKNVLNFKNSLTILSPGSGKSLCYQLPSLVVEGLTIVVCPLVASITDQLTNLPGCLSGASLTSFTNQNQRNEIFSAIRNKKIKILFITPERLALENFTELDEISLICFDDCISASPLSQNFRSSYISIISMLNKIKPNSILLLGNNVTNLIENSLLELFNIDKQNVIKEKLLFPKNFRVSVSKDDNKLTNLVKLLRSSNLKNIGSILIFCNLRKSVDKVTSFLNQNGLSASAYHAGKSEIERQLILTNFLNDKIKILVSTAGFCNGICKENIKYVILFEMPPSIDLFLQQLSRGGRDKTETSIHVFLNDEDYFIQRNMIYLDNIDKVCINKFVENIFSQCVSKIQYENNQNENQIFQVINDTSQDLSKSKKIFYDLPKRISFNFTKISELTGIKKNMQIFLLLRLLNEKKINCLESTDLSSGKLKASCLGVGPTDINLRFFKRLPHEVAEEEPNLKLILESSKELVGGIYKFSTGDVCQKLGITYVDLINYLYFLQTKGEIGYESRDEGMFLNIEKIPENLNDIVNYLFLTNKYLVNLNIKKLNATYCLLRKYASSSIDPFLVNKNEKTVSIRCLNLYNDFKSYEEAFINTFDSYFTADESK